MTSGSCDGRREWNDVLLQGFIFAGDVDRCIVFIYLFYFFLLALQPPLGVVFYSPLVGFLASSLARFLDHTHRRATFGRTPLNEWWIRRRDLYLTTHNTHNRQISLPWVGFEPTISAGERPKTYALDRAATGTGIVFISLINQMLLEACFTKLSVSHPVQRWVLEWFVNDELGSLEGSGLRIIKVFIGGTEENNRKPRSGFSVCQSKLEPGTSEYTHNSRALPLLYSSPSATAKS